MDKFELVSHFKPCGDQPVAIEKLTEGVLKNEKFQTLLGVTGSGKTYTIANVIKNINRPTLVISHNKTLAAQLYSEFKQFFPHNAVEYFVSYYDYYQPEAYIPSTDTYIEKDASINDRLDRLRLRATSNLMSRRDCVLVASVSCIYNLGSPADYKEMLVEINLAQEYPRDAILEDLLQIQYERNDIDFKRGTFRVRGDVVEVYPAYEETAIRIGLFGAKIEKIMRIDPVSGNKIEDLDRIFIYPAKHFIANPDMVESAVNSIMLELNDRLKILKKENKFIEAQRLESRTLYDIEMIKEIGYCSGVENYARHLSNRPAGSRPFCLIDYFPKDFLMVIDESHVTIPQVRGMFEGDKSRKTTLVEHGFRLPSCLDNRPLKFPEFESLINQAVFISATPADYEIKKSKEKIIEQIIRPTGLIDPRIKVLPTDGQIDDLIGRIRQRAESAERVLVTCLTKRMSEDLTKYLANVGLSVAYLHSEIDAIERVKILKELRQKKFDCLVGINLLREGIDLPEVSLVAILDADKEGFLRSQTSLIQVAGRAARHINGEVIMYADTITDSMRRAISETSRRRKVQLEYNKKNNITPRSIEKAIHEGIEIYEKAKEFIADTAQQSLEEYETDTLISDLEREMELAARNLDFERAAYFRDQVAKIKNKI